MKPSGLRTRGILAGLIAIVGLSVAAPSSASGATSVPALRVRKSVTDLTAAERSAFVDAVLALKATPSPYDPSLTYYDQFVAWHVAITLCQGIDPLARHQQMAHAGPMFLPWHREYLLLFEDALQSVGGTGVTLPYWDWTDHSSVASVFADDFMGGDGDPKQDYAVTTGPFRKGNWVLTVRHDSIIYEASNTRYLTRHFGRPESLPTQAEVQEAFAAPLYDVPPYDNTSDPTTSFRNALEGHGSAPGLKGCIPGDIRGGVSFGGELEPLGLGHGGGLHNLVHGWVGGSRDPMRSGPLFGTMSMNSASPNDPSFFLHHANVDRLWAEWQKVHGVNTYRPVSGYELNSLNDVMEPFDEVGIISTPADVADIAELGYLYTVPAITSSASRASPSPESIAPQDRARASSESRLFCRIGEKL